MSVIKSVGRRFAGQRTRSLYINLRKYRRFLQWRFSEKTTDIETKSAASELREEGIVIEEDYFTAEQCEEIRAKIDELIEGDRGDALYVIHGDDFDDDETDGAIVIERGGDYDVGMIDIRHLDRSFPELSETKNDPHISDIVQGAGGEEYEPKILHAYVNKSVTDTRRNHWDTQDDPHYKAFIYLTDVPDESYGPYRFARKSHRSVVKRFVNNVVGAIAKWPGGDARLLFQTKPVLGEKGTLVVSNQAGVHRGTPQKEGKERYVLVIRFAAEDTNE